MIEMILLATLAQVPQAPKSTAQFQPCVWPNKCVQQSLAVSPIIGPCQPPRVCEAAQKG